MGFIHDEVARDGHIVDYLCADDLPDFASGPLARFAFPLLIHEKARAAARAGRPYDIINVHEPSSAVIATSRRLAGKPIVCVTSHGLEQRAWALALEERRLGREGPRLKTRILQPTTSLWQSSIGLRWADHIFCLNEDDRQYLAVTFGRRLGEITRIFPAADLAYSAGSLERPYSRASNILFAGTWRKNKGIEDFVPAFTALADRHPSVRLTVLGPGFPAAVVRSAFPERVRSLVNCVSAATESETQATFASADIFVLPSIFEGTPLTLIEAMASGLPIVTTATCGMKDVVRDGENGLLVPIRSPEAIERAVECLIASEALRTRLGRAARTEALARYTWPSVAIPVKVTYEALRHSRPEASRASNDRALRPIV